MKLKDYIKEAGISVPDAAIELKISRGYLYELIAERIFPGKKLITRIVEWSGGMVKVKDIWGGL